MNAAWRWITSFSHCIHLERFCSAEMFLSCVTTRCSFKPVHARISDSIPRVIVGVISGLPSGRGNISLEVNIWTNSPFSPAFPSVADFHLFPESLQPSASTWKSQKIQPSLNFYHAAFAQQDVLVLISCVKSWWRSLCFFTFSRRCRSSVAMPFGCLTIREKREYNNPSDVTDKYDLGQIVKSWVSVLL